MTLGIYSVRARKEIKIRREGIDFKIKEIFTIVCISPDVARFQNY
jgi:hypothetical protein